MNQPTTATIPWGVKHQAETRAALLRIAADLGVTGEKNRAWELAHFANSWHFDSEAEFREKLAALPNLDSMVRKIRARAEGREVVTVSQCFHVKLADGSYIAIKGVPYIRHFWKREEAEEIATMREGARVVHVTLKRMRILRKVPTS